MRCIAVIDLCAGQVVHAVRGAREHYAPVRSQLCTSAAPEAVADALREQLGFTAFYVADLDAIQRRGSSRDVIAALVRRHADCEWWIDAGFADPSRLEDYLDARNVHAVIGSESLYEVGDFAVVRAALPRPDAVVLSLDHRGGSFIGPAALGANANLWPSSVIAMNLDRVGAGTGPDFAMLADLRARARRLTAAGGVRDVSDLARLRDAGVSNVLLATALHRGMLTRADLAAYNADGHDRHLAAVQRHDR